MLLLCSSIILSCDTNHMTDISASAITKNSRDEATLEPQQLIFTITIFCSLAAFGAAYGTAKSGVGIAAMSVMRPELIMKSIIPVVMAGIIAIYGLVVAVLIANGCK